MVVETVTIDGTEYRADTEEGTLEEVSDLPHSGSYQMVEEIGPFFTGYNFYFDDDGDLWIGVNDSLETNHDGPRFLSKPEQEELVEAIRERNGL